MIDTSKNRNIKIVIALLALAILLAIPAAYCQCLATPIAEKIQVVCSIIQYSVFIYNLFFFRSFLYDELAHSGLNSLIFLFNIYCLGQIVLCLNFLIGFYSTYFNLYISVFMNLIQLSVIAFVLILFRIRNNGYEKELGLIAITLFLSFVSGYFNQYVLYVDKKLSFILPWLYILYLAPDAMFILLYRRYYIIINDKDYTKAEDKTFEMEGNKNS